MPEDLLKIIVSYADSHENCFDDFLSDHKDSLNCLQKKQLSFLINARVNCAKASQVVKFTRAELENGIRTGVVNSDGPFTRVCDDFLIAESFFE